MATKDIIGIYYQGRMKGTYMDRLTEQLMAIESEAQEAMNAMTKESAHLARKAEEDLALRIAQIEQGGAEAVRRLGREADGEAAARIAMVEEEYMNKVKLLDHEYKTNKNDIKRRIIRDVLYGEL